MSFDRNRFPVPGGHEPISEENLDLVAKLREVPPLEDFADQYEEDEIERDSKVVASIKEGFNRRLDALSPDEHTILERNKRLADAFEATVGELINSHNWFGEEAIFIFTTEYDDLVNAADGVVEIPATEESVIRQPLSIDITYDKKPTSVRRKIARNIKKLLSRDSIKIKYFSSEVDPSFVGPIKDTVPIVVGLDQSHAVGIINKISQIIRLQAHAQGDKREDARQTILSLKKELAAHPAQVTFLNEMMLQLDLYLMILSRETDEVYGIRKEAIMNIRAMFSKILSEKRAIANQAEELSDDQVSVEIRDVVKDFEKRVSNIDLTSFINKLGV
ncbi:MAG TPA: hypothetical protein VJJ24_03615 [Candidatus Paceibacterota bacterium]